MRSRNIDEGASLQEKAKPPGKKKKGLGDGGVKLEENM